MNEMKYISKETTAVTISHRNEMVLRKGKRNENKRYERNEMKRDETTVATISQRKKVNEEMRNEERGECLLVCYSFFNFSFSFFSFFSFYFFSFVFLF